MKKILVVAVAVLGIAPGVFAQTPQSEEEQVKARQKISLMESVLESAVANGADSLMRAVRVVMPPDALMLTGVPEARGFRLEGYGVFFDVQVPAFRPTMAWTLRQMVDKNGLGAVAAVNQLKAYIDTVQDPRQRAALESALRRLELQVGPVGPINNDQVRAANDPQVRAAGGAQTVSSQSIAPQAIASPQPAQAQIDPSVLDDPAGVYTREVSVAIVDAMLENSGPLPIADNEWLTVAARDNVRPDRLVPGDTSNISSIVFRVKGADLAAFHTGRMSLDEARKHVEVKQF